MDEILRSIENLSFFLVGCEHVHEEGALKNTFSGIRGDLNVLHGKLKEIHEPSVTGIIIPDEKTTCLEN
jgi:hypothetical protein